MLHKCGKCQSTKPFYKNKSTLSGLDDYCKSCRNKATYNQRRQTRGAQHRKAAHTKLLKVRGLTEDQYQEMVKQQQNKCAICGYPETVVGGTFHQTKDLSIDHDHVTNQARALLCQACNAAIGLLKDSSPIVQKAADYLKRYGK